MKEWVKIVASNIGKSVKFYFQKRWKKKSVKFHFKKDFKKIKNGLEMYQIEIYKIIQNIYPMDRGARYLTGGNLKVFWAEFSTLS
jgi:hypothetical protein